MASVTLLPQPAWTAPDRLRPMLLASLPVALLLAGLCATPYGHVAPALLAGGVFVVWSFRRPAVALSTIVLLSLHVIEKTEEITPVELVYGAYFFGYLVYWFAGRLLRAPGTIVLWKWEWALLAFLALGFVSGALIAVAGRPLTPWAREMLTLMRFLLYFPARDVLREDRGPATVFSVLLAMFALVAVYNLVTYRASTFVAEYMWQLLASRKSIGDHFFFPACVFLLSLLAHAPTRKALAAFTVLLLLFGIALLLTFSRGFWIGTAAAFGVLFVVSGWPERKRMLWGVAAGTALALGVILLLLGGLGESVLRVISMRLTGSGTGPVDISLLERLRESQAVLRLIGDAPLLGHGVGASFRHFDIIRKVTLESLFIHNGYLFLLFKTGFCGLLAFGLFVAALLGTGWRAAGRIWRSPPETALVRGALAVILGQLLVSVTSNTFVSKESILVFTLSAGLIAAGRIARTRDR